METEIRKILIIDDNDDYRKLLLTHLNNLFPNTDIKEYDILKHGLPPPKFNWEKFDVLILDYYLGDDETGLDWFRKYKKSVYFPATVIITGMHDEDTAALVLKSGVHHYLNKKQLTKNGMYDAIEKALAVRASLVAEYNNQINLEYNFDTFLTGYLIGIEERLTVEILRDAKRTGRPPDRRLIDTEIERERQDILNLNDDPTIQEAKIALLEIATEHIRNKSW
ncbi:MAG: response regulator [Proteobacteria bacterium]|nr:response regulator [Pseudomonadota bacterium]